MIHKIITMTVLVHDDKVLCLTRSNAMAHRPGDWDLPGGRLDPGEEYDEGAVREVFEETGLTISDPKLVYATTKEYDHDTVIYLFYVASTSRIQIRLSSEHTAFEWISFDELLARRLFSQGSDPVQEALGFISKYNLLHSDHASSD